MPNIGKIKKKNSISNFIICLVITLFTILCIIPFVVILSTSLTKEESIAKKGYSLLPRDFSLQAYQIVFGGNIADVANSYKVTIIVTCVGTILSLLLIILMAYSISRKRYRYRNVVNFYMAFTMLFNGGMVPWFIICSRIGLRNNYAAMIIPYLLNPWFVFILRNFFSTIPDSFEESAYLDGAGELTILFRIYMRIALPGIATIALFDTLMYWNDWWLSMMLCGSNDYVSVQYYLMRIIQYIEFLKNSAMGANANFNSGVIPAESVRMALCIVAIGPIVFAFPFFQRYFIKGLIIGAIKG